MNIPVLEERKHLAGDGLSYTDYGLYVDGVRIIGSSSTEAAIKKYLWLKKFWLWNRTVRKAKERHAGRKI